MRLAPGRALLVACGLLAGGCAPRSGPTLSGPLASVSFRNTQPEGISTAEILLHRRSARGSRVIYRGTREVALGEAVQVPQTWTAQVRTLEILESAEPATERTPLER